MSWPRRTRDDRDRDTLHTRPDERYPPPPHVEPDRGRTHERMDAYLTSLVLGLAPPFLLAIPLYPLIWYPTWFIVLPVAGFLWALLRSAQTAPPPPSFTGGPMPWDFGPLLSPQLALTWAAAVLAGWFVLSRLCRRRAYPHVESSARRGFRGGLRCSLFVLLLLAVLWSNRALQMQGAA